jgi:hypothetical protein
MSESPVTVVTEVEIPDITPDDSPEPVEPVQITVVAEDAPEDTSLPAVVDHEGRLARIEIALEQLAANQALATAQLAVVAEVTEENQEILNAPAPEPDIEPDVEPVRKHFMHRSWRELLGKS